MCKAGKLKLLAVGSPKRSPLFPDVPTLDEAGLKGFDADTWFGFYAPAGTPAAVVTRLNTRDQQDPGAARRSRTASLAIGGDAGADVARPTSTCARPIDGTRFGALIKARNIKGD